MSQTAMQAPPAVHSFCWFELNTRNVEGVKKFYNSVFGWTTTATPMGPFTYHHWHDRSGAQFGGIMDMNQPEWGDVPSHWMSYISVKDIDAKAEKVKQLGGNICVPPTDIPHVGRFCVINDPTGATLSLIQLNDQKPIGSAIVWNECMTKNALKARDFYTKLFGWTTDEMPMGGGVPYIICKNGECGLGGIFQMEGPQFEHVPAHWMNYIGTDNVDRDAAKVTANGGTIIVPPTDIPNNIGRFCVISDPGGGHIALYQSAMQK